MNRTIRIKPLFQLGWRYSVSILTIAIALSVQLFLTPLGELESPFLLCLAAVMVSAWYGGRGAGILATVLAALSGSYLFLSPTYSCVVDNVGQNLRLFLFVLEGLFLSTTISGLTVAREQVICGQEALRESEEKFRLVAESLPQMVWTAEANGSVDYYNQRCAEYSGISQQDSYGWGWKAFLHPDDQQKTIDAWNHAVATGELYECEHRLRRADGEFRWHLSRGFPLRDSHGNIIKWFGTATEIHQQKQTEAQLRESQELFQNFMDYSPIAAYIKEESGRYIFVNRIVEQTWHRPLMDWLGKTDFDFFSEPIAQQIRDNDLTVLAGDHAIELLETTENTDDTHYWLSYKFPLKTSSGQRWLAGMSMDITERQQMEEALRQSEQRFRQAVINAPYPLIIHAEDGEVLQINQTWTELTGYTHSDIPTMADWTEKAYGERREVVREQIDQLYALNDKFHDGEFAIATKQGSQRIWDFSSAPLGKLPDGRRIIISIATDISDRKQSEAILKRQSHELAQTNRLKDEFLATLSHELRTPLNSILGLAKLLPRRRLNEEKMARALETISRNTQSLAQLIEDVLDMSDIITGELTLHVSPVELMPIIERAIASIQAAAEAKKLQIETQIDGSVAPILGDASRLQQIVWNLLSNAVKFTPQEGQIQVCLEQIEDQAQIQVRDTGIGIHGEFLPFVFDRFRQEDGSLTRSHGGIGMGLAIVRYLVELQGGTVWAESPGSGQGATFTVRFPIFANQGIRHKT